MLRFFRPHAAQVQEHVFVFNRLVLSPFVSLKLHLDFSNNIIRVKSSKWVKWVEVGFLLYMQKTFEHQIP